MTEKTLTALKKGEIGTVVSVLGDDAIRRRLYDIGCIKGAMVRLLGVSPLGDLRAYAICGAIIAIRAKDACGIRVRVDDI
jgi:ferrous iron transport protein A